ncbi:hypothetical protein LJB87_00705 [Alistipes sp. OttesenSCG-928-L06]|nr:hypothetical protein [Alistipes sp. OttesenSCG-928-L06]
MIAVIADDITGAAEIAGIGLRFGLRVALVMDAAEGMPDVDLLVYATDTRSMGWADAVQETHRVVHQLKEGGCRTFFKKVDSALRGHVVPELRVMLEETGLPKALYLPQNPSKGRVVRGGVYYIDEKPLNETLFGEDPEFPTLTAVVRERLPEITAVLSAGEKPEEAGIFAANAESATEIEAFVAAQADDTLLAGGADLFTVWLRTLGWQERALPEFEGLGMQDAIIVRGSTAQHSLAEFDYIKRKNVPLREMPSDVFSLKNNPKAWFSTLEEIYEQHRAIAIAVGRHPRRDGKYAIRLRNIMALATLALVNTRLPHELIIEGGATAFAVLRALGWNRFRVTDEIAPGVVRMKLDGNLEDFNIWDDCEVYITLKPGSYPWGDRLFR